MVHLAVAHELAHGFTTTFVDAIEAVPGMREHGLLHDRPLGAAAKSSRS